jgi:transposase-like protein
MAYSNDIRHAAMELRKRGYSLKEISQRFNIAKSTASLWSENIALDKSAEARLLTVIKRGQFVSAQNKKAKTRATEDRYLKEAREEMKSNPNYDKIICAMIYWCEGGKNPRYGVSLTNSDPNLIRTFLKLLRNSFVLDEAKFHPCIHLHSYHSPEIQLDFWSKITDINKQQFIKPYQKSNSGKRIHENYQGCLSLRYASNDLARQLMATAKAFLNITGI